jgi:hypothetical protein
MKKNVVLCFLTVLLFLFVACDDGNSSNGNTGNNDNNGNNGNMGKLTITGLPDIGTQAVYVFSTGTDISSYMNIVNAYMDGNYIGVGASVTSGNVFTLFRWVNNVLMEDYFSSTGSFPVLLLNSAGSMTDSTIPMYCWATVSFSTGVGTTNYSQFEPVVDDSMAILAITSEISGLSANTIDSPHNVVLEDIHLRSLSLPVLNTADEKFYNDSFGLILSLIPGKYINLDLSNCKGTEIINSYPGASINRGTYPSYGNAGNIISVKLPNSVTKLGSLAFYRFSSLTSIVLPNSLSRIEMQAFQYCSSLQSLTLPETLEFIGGDAFVGTGLINIDIPASVTTIGTDVFASNGNLTEVIIRSTVPPMAYGQSFRNCSNLTGIYVPDASVAVYKANANWSQYNELIKPLSSKP